MKYLAVCLLLAAGYCQADVVTRNLYRNFYDSLADYCECQNSAARWQTLRGVTDGKTVKAVV